MASAGDVLAQLERAVAPTLEVKYTTPFELLVALLLAVQATEERAGPLAETLVARYPNPQALARADVNEIEQMIRTLPLASRKSAGLSHLAQVLVDCNRGEVPRSFVSLMALPGVGPKTAGIVAGELGDKTTFPVERHAARVITRLGFEPESFEHLVSPGARYATALRLTIHGRHCCKAKRPMCALCGLASVCPSEKEP